jgi:hypothetical protein
VANAVLVSAVTPIMIMGDEYPIRVPWGVRDGVRRGTATDVTPFFWDFMTAKAPR